MKISWQSYIEFSALLHTINFRRQRLVERLDEGGSATHRRDVNKAEQEAADADAKCDVHIPGGGEVETDDGAEVAHHPCY